MELFIALFGLLFYGFQYLSDPKTGILKNRVDPKQKKFEEGNALVMRYMPTAETTVYRDKFEEYKDKEFQIYEYLDEDFRFIFGDDWKKHAKISLDMKVMMSSMSLSLVLVRAGYVAPCLVNGSCLRLLHPHDKEKARPESKFLQRIDYYSQKIDPRLYIVIAEDHLRDEYLWDMVYAPACFWEAKPIPLNEYLSRKGCLFD